MTATGRKTTAIAILILGLLPAARLLGLTLLLGSPELDSTLEQINRRAKAELGAFTAELSASYGLPMKTISYMLADLNMEPVELYLAAELSRLSKRPLEEVLRAYRANRAKGWGVIAGLYGIKPGSATFLQLKSRSSARLSKMKS